MKIINQVLRTLNNLADTDRETINNLISHRIRCSQALDDHPTVIVGPEDPTIPNSPPVVGLLGILNAVVEELCVANGEGRLRVGYFYEKGNNESAALYKKPKSGFVAVDVEELEKKEQQQHEDSEIMREVLKEYIRGRALSAYCRYAYETAPLQTCIGRMQELGKIWSKLEDKEILADTVEKRFKEGKQKAAEMEIPPYPFR